MHLRKHEVVLPLVVFLLVAGFAVRGVAHAQSTSEAPAHSGAEDATLEASVHMVAAPVEGAIVIDGRLDETAWQQATPATDFRQFEPTEGARATQRTEVRVLYGSDDLYVGVVLYDETPDGIEQALGRRDEYNRADWFLVSIDSYFDRRTAYVFGVSAAGVQYDAIQRGGPGGPGPGGGGGPGGPGDNSWDAIWYSAARVTAEGWTVEMRIPYSMLRFSKAEAQTWGIHFTRRIPRLGEVAEWPLVPRTERSNLVAQFGQLTGITGVEPRRNVQLRPYGVTRLQTEESLDEPGTMAADGSVDVGGDLKVGFGPNITLDATINPDFGQVESDPAVLNLTAFETFFDEKRPFFLEGSQIYEFSVGPGELLYTRRIGASAPIIGAAKLSGRTAGGTSFGVLGATTGEGFQPNRHYGVARVNQQLGTYSSVGGILTSFDGPSSIPDGRRQALTGGADWDLRFADNQYGIEGFASFTHRRGLALERDAETGFAGKVWTRKRQGALTGAVGVDVYSDRFDPNDIGQLRQNNFIVLLNTAEYEIRGGQSFGPFQRASIDWFGNQRFSYREGLDLGFELDIGSRWMLRSFQEIELDVAIENPFGGYDLYETRGLGPWARPASIELGGEFETDERRSWQVEPELSLTLYDDGGRAYATGLRAEADIGTRLSLSANVEGEWERDVTAWSSNETFRRTEDGAWMIGLNSRAPTDQGTGDYASFDDQGQLDEVLGPLTPSQSDHYYVPVFGARDTRSLDLTLRGTITFVRNLSLQLYSQLFLARGRYDRFHILQDRDTLAPFEPFPKRDEFAFSSLQSNVVLRWEYRPGSTLYLVWTHGRQAEDVLNPLAPWGASPYDRRIGEHISDTFDIFPQNAFLIKLDYTFLY